MTTCHSVPTSKVTSTKRCHSVELFCRFNSPECLGVVLAHERESITNSIMSAELFNDTGPYSVFFVLHLYSVADDEHSMLRSRQKDIRAVG